MLVCLQLVALKISVNTQIIVYRRKSKGSGTASFDSLLNSAMNLVQQTEDYSNAAEVEEVKYAMGQSDSLHDLMVAQQKANVSLQYTVAVKNTAVEAYRSIMNMQI